MSCFLDTSALLKIYHVEEETDKYLSLYQSDENLIISELAAVEIVSAFYKKVREGVLQTEEVNLLRQKFEHDAATRFHVVKFSSLVTEKAKELLAEHANTVALKTLDAVQLAFFIYYCEEGDQFLTCDKLLANVATRYTTTDV